MQIKFGPQLLL